MRHLSRWVYLPIVSILLLSCNTNQKRSDQIVYPDTFRDSTVIDNYHGTLVADPYRWLENEQSADTRNWIDRQRTITQAYLSRIPYLEDIRSRLKDLWNYPRYGTPFKVGGKYFYKKNTGLQDQYVLYIMDSLNGEPRPFLDPNKMSDDGSIAIRAISVSSDGRYVAYGISESGSDWLTLKVREVKNGQDLPDVITWIKFSGASWYQDGFFYSRYPKPDEHRMRTVRNEDHKIYYHTLGTAQKEDQLIFDDVDHPLNYNWSEVISDKYLIICSSKGTSGNKVWVKDLSKDGAALLNLIDNYDNDHYVVGSIENKLLLFTNYQAPHNRLVLVDYNHPDPVNWKEIIPEDSAMVLESVKVVGHALAANYEHDVASEIKIFDFEGQLISNIPLPAKGTVYGFYGTSGDPETFFTFTSFTYPPVIYRYNMDSKEIQVFHESEAPFDPGNYITKQVFYKSADGTRIPMFIVHKKDLEMDGSNPTILYGYGGFNISLNPYFSPSRIALLEKGGIFAMANLRGGGEYGEEWHKDGSLRNKQNTFDDFIAAAEYLIEQGYTSVEKLGIEGRMNGGLLVGAVMTQRPDLFKVALPGGGIMDMLRYQNFTSGPAWITEYGSSDDKEYFEVLYQYSPLHNIKKGTAYPATMVTTSDMDDRVVPAHSFKFAACLQYAQKGNNPVLIRIVKKAGHGSGNPINTMLEEEADKLSFFLYNVGVK